MPVVVTPNIPSGRRTAPPIIVEVPASRNGQDRNTANAEARPGGQTGNGNNNNTERVESIRSDRYSAAPTISRHTAANLEDEVEGVQWTGNNEPYRSFLENFSEALRVTDLSGRGKLLIRERFLCLFNRYDNEYRRTRALNTTARWTVALGSILITAMIAIDDEISERSPASQTLYYFSFGASIVVTAINTVAELTQLSKQFYTNAATHHLLEIEGWSFLLLRGRYKQYKNHRECWQTFLYRVEKIHQTAASQRLLLYQRQESTGGGFVVPRAGGAPGVENSILIQQANDEQTAPPLAPDGLACGSNDVDRYNAPEVFYSHMLQNQLFPSNESSVEEPPPTLNIVTHQ
jgi:hypothetical protein